MRWIQASKRSGSRSLRQPAPGQDEGVLQRVLGEPRVAQDPMSDRVERITDLVHQDGERLPIALPGLFDEVSIHPRPSGRRGRVATDYPL